MKRRSLLLGGLAAAAGGLYLRPGDEGAGHNAYFLDASRALGDDGLAKATLLIDRARLLANVDTLRSHIGERFNYRVVAKSLPSIGLLELVMARANTHRLMLFHQPFINAVAAAIPAADILLGKPLPVAAAHNFYTQFEGGAFDPQTQLRWLVDTPQRTLQYRALAEQLQQQMPVAIELDVGLHRGGVNNDEDFLAMLSLIRESPYLQFSGLMGYEPHIVKVPGNPVRYRDKAMVLYTHYLTTAKAFLGPQWPDNVVLNCGGSPTYQMYNEGTYPFNELSAGSSLVKPTDFDLATLADHLPAAFIATPVLKTTDGVTIPGINIGPLQTLWNRNRQRSFFTDGGYWKAQPESPPGLVTNPIYGRSTNQEMLNGSNRVTLAVDDWIFLRPTQSEFVFLQFGDIAVLDQGRIVERWPVFAEQPA